MNNVLDTSTVEKRLTQKKVNTSKPKPREIDPLDYDMSTGLHYDPVRNPPTPHEYKNDDGEYEYYADAYWVGRVKKDNPRDFTDYLQMWNEYTNTDIYKRRKAVSERYIERVKTLTKNKVADSNEYLKALMERNKELDDIRNNT